MKNKVKFFLILFILILFTGLFYSLIYYPNILENFKQKKPITFNIPKGNNIIQHNEFEIYNQNYGEPWISDYVSYNYPTVQDYGDSFS